MHRIHSSLASAAIAIGLLAAGCSKGTDSTTTTSTAVASPDITTAPDSAASADVTPPAPVDTASALATTPAAVTTAAAVAPAASTQAVGFTDIKGSFGEKEITQLAQLGVFGDATGTFNAIKPITRREFVRWLFKANNAIWANEPNNLVHPSQGGDSAFTDVKSSDPDEQYIQGLQDAGVSVGFPDKTFKPDQPITREQALAIKAALDRGGVDASYVVTKKDPTYGYANLPAWKDKLTISPEYVGAIATGMHDDQGAANESSFFVFNVQRTFGVIAALKPKQVLTRGQAALMLWKIGPHVRSTDRKNARSAADALAPATSPTP